jgi:hypothetical protein
VPSHPVSPRLLALACALITALSISVAVTIQDDDGRSVDVVVTLGGPGREQVRVTPAGQQAVDVAQRTELGDPLREPADPSRTPAGVLDGPLAAQEFPGCRTRFVRNYSSRNGQTPRVIVWHQTVSRERGWASQDALTAMADRPSSGVSWHFLIGRTGGRCTFSVPLHMKAWTQGNANPVAIGIEVEAYGDEPTYVHGAGERKLLAVTRELGRRHGIPMRRGRVTFTAGCRPVVQRAGIIEHSDLGSCGGGHADVTPWPTDRLIAKAAQADPKTRAARKACDVLQWHRARAHRTGHWTRPRAARARQLKQAIAAGRRTCPLPDRYRIR